MKKNLVLISMLSVLFFSSCKQDEDYDNNLPENTPTVTTPITTTTTTTTATEEIPEDEKPSTGDSFTAGQSIYINLNNASVSEDNVSWKEITTSKTKLLSKSAGIKYTTDSLDASTGLIKLDITEVTQETSVYITGTMTTGGIKIQTNPDFETGLYLKDVSITSSDYPAIEITKGGAVTVFLEGENELIDGRSYGTGYGEEYSLTEGETYLNDDGTETPCTVVQSVQKEGSDSKGTLYCKGSMSICGTGSLKVTEGYKHCVVSKSYLTLESGTYDLTSTGKSGFYGDCGITVKDGTYTFNGTGEISSSKYHKAHAFNVDDDTYTDAFVKISGGTFNLDSYNGKGINAPIVEISGGSVTVNSDGVTGYTKDDNKKATYIDADGVKYTNASVTFSAEGIEGAQSVTITGGTIEVTAVDDALNVSNTGGTFTMSAGSLYAYSSKGDGIDCNGNILISGGTVVSYAPTGSEDALDCGDGGYSIKITGGTVAAVSGSSRGTESLSSSSQHILYASGSSGGMGGMGTRPGQSTSSGSSGTTYSTVLVKVNSAESLCFKVPSSSFGLLMLSSPDFTSSSSSTYQVYPQAAVSGGTSFHGLYTTLPSVSSTGNSATMSIK